MKPLTCVAKGGSNSKILITNGYVHESHALILFSFVQLIFPDRIISSCIVGAEHRELSR